MPLYVTVSEGPRADRTRPILAISDQRVIGQMLRSLGQLGEEAEHEAEPAGPVDRQAPAPEPREAA